MAQQQQQNIPLEVYPRAHSGKNAAYRTRRSKLIPAVIYGPKIGKEGQQASIPICLEPRNFLQVYNVKGRTTLVELSLKEGAPTELAGSKVLIKDMQTNPLKREVMHIDLFQLDLNQKLRVAVPLKFIGKAKGIIEGGVLAIITRQIEIKCLPADIPHEIEVDVTELGLNQSLKIHELAEKTKNTKYEIIYDTDITLVGVAKPEEEKAPVVEAVAAVEGAAVAGAPGAAGAVAGAAGAGGAAAAPGAGATAGAAGKDDKAKK